MLRTLRIRHLAVIEDLEVEFGEGLNVLTGETGAGKSILVGALGLVAGERADSTRVRAGCERATIEAEFSIGDRADLARLLEERGIDATEDRLVVRREVAASGPGRVFVNGSPATVSVLRELSDELLEMHGQHDHEDLIAPERHLELLDEFASAGPLREAVGVAHRGVVAAEESRGRLLRLGEEREAIRERLTAQLREIEAARIRPGEGEALDRERRMLVSSGRVFELLDGAVGALADGEANAAALIAGAARRVEELATLDPGLEEIAGRLESARIEIQDVGASLADYRERARFEPGRLEAVEARRALLEGLRLRYGPDEEAVLAFRDGAAKELATLEDLDAESTKAARAVSEAERLYREAATALTEARTAAAARLGPEVERQLGSLALPRARFTARLSPAKGRMLPGAPAVPLHPRGAERVDLLLAANPGEEARPIGRAASGGELSRVMLAVHAAVEAKGAPRVLVFDEVDQGVGGPVADAVGSRLRRLAGRHQVLCVTHLPQVAAHASRQYHVHKKVAGGRTSVVVSLLDDPERVEELARMLGGREVTPASRRNAEELLAATGPRPRARRRA